MEKVFGPSQWELSAQQQIVHFSVRKGWIETCEKYVNRIDFLKVSKPFKVVVAEDLKSRGKVYDMNIQHLTVGK